MGRGGGSSALNSVIILRRDPNRKRGVVKGGNLRVAGKGVEAGKESLAGKSIAGRIATIHFSFHLVPPQHLIQNKHSKAFGEFYSLTEGILVKIPIVDDAFENSTR